MIYNGRVTAYINKMILHILRSYLFRINFISYVKNGADCYSKNGDAVTGNHSIFRYDNFIGCFSADKIKMSARK